jgi:group II intron reverse transcriptase/maturase
MRSPERVLNSLSEHSKDSSYKFERLYRILFNEEMFYVAYQRIYAKEGNMTKGSDGQTIDNMSLKRVEKLIGTLKDETYQPQPSKRVYIPKKNGKKRPLGVPTFNDKLIQDVVRMVLEAIYEGSFEYTSHGFRPNRSCHTALAHVQKVFNGAKWFVEGDIKGFFDNINHDALINILKERIADERFIRLVRKFLKAGYIEEWQFHNTYSGTPQGGIISPILANIYLDKLDKYIKEYSTKFDKGKKRQSRKETTDFDNARKRIVRKLKSVKDEKQKAKLILELKAIEQGRAKYPSGEEMDADYRRMKYTRYADDFLVGIIGSKQDAQRIKEDIKNFLADKLALELSDEKTLITHTEKPAKFLGYEISIRKSNERRRDNRGRLRRTYGKRVCLNVSSEVVRKKLFDWGVLEMKTHDGKGIWKPKCKSGLIFNDDLEILDSYNREIIGFYNYYSIANNCAHALNNFKYIMEYSMYKTFAGKYKSRTRKVNKKYRKNGRFIIKYMTKTGEKERYFYDGGFKRKKPTYNSDCDTMPRTIYTAGRTSLIERLKACECELCGASDDLVMHHVRKLKNLQGKESWERHMIARKRKTIAVCRSCHKKIHDGKID